MQVPTFTATIYVGFRVGPLNEPEKRFHGISDVDEVCQAFCNEIGLCVTVSPTMYIYKGGKEHGAAIGLINYPRFPKQPEEIRATALKLAELLRVKLDQFKVSVVFPDITVMIGEDKH